MINNLMLEAPEPDTLQLPIDVRRHIGMNMFSQSQLERRGDWTAFAHYTGKIQILAGRFHEKYLTGLRRQMLFCK